MGEVKSAVAFLFSARHHVFVCNQTSVSAPTTVQGDLSWLQDRPFHPLPLSQVLNSTMGCQWGVMDFVYGSFSFFDMDCEVKIVCCYCRFAYIGFV